MSEQEPTVIIVDDRLWKSVGRDMFSFGTVLLMIGVGWIIESSALQWVGALLWFLMIIGRMVSIKNGGKMRIAEARKFLDDLERQP